MKIKTTLSIVAISLFLMVSAGAQTLSTQNEYWPDGKIRVSKKIDDLGNIMAVAYCREDGTLEQDVKYDMEGNKIEVSYYGENGRLRPGADGWAAIRNQYQGGNLVMESYYGADGKLIERKQYNSVGDLVSRQYVGDGQLPAEEFNPAPTLAGTTESFYDSSGRPEGTTSVVRDDDDWPWWHHRRWRNR
ncbi:MAG: hypothetical protein HQ594_04345 [Candidatus Omnitrophica bacterium]|nr:hypothetical protein [Candidatus Omnitrophota bacterium]